MSTVYILVQQSVRLQEAPFGYEGDSSNAKWVEVKRALGSETAKEEVRQRALDFALGNCTLKKIPNAVLTRCEWGKDDYSLAVANLPPRPVEPGTQPSLFEEVEP